MERKTKWINFRILRIQNLKVDTLFVLSTFLLKKKDAWNTVVIYSNTICRVHIMVSGAEITAVIGQDSQLSQSLHEPQR